MPRFILTFFIPNLHSTTRGIPTLVWGIQTENNGFLVGKCSFQEAGRGTKNVTFTSQKRQLHRAEQSSFSWGLIEFHKNTPTTLPRHCSPSSPSRYPTQDIFDRLLSRAVSVLCSVEECGRWKQTKPWKILQLLKEVHIVVMYTSVVFQLSFVLCKVGKITQNKARKATFPASMEEV